MIVALLVIVALVDMSKDDEKIENEGIRVSVDAESAVCLVSYERYRWREGLSRQECR